MFKSPTANLSSLCIPLVFASDLIIASVYAGDSSIQNASEHFVWCIYFPFANLSLHPTNKI